MATLVSDLENVFGRDNINHWADLDNDDNAGTISSRINWAINLATAEVQAQLTATSYTWDVVVGHILVNNAIAIKAGLWLYANRAKSDEGDGTTPTNPMRRHEKWLDLFFKQLSTGALKLDIERSGRSFPAVVVDGYGDVSTEIVDGLDEGRVRPWYWIVG